MSPILTNSDLSALMISWADLEDTRLFRANLVITDLKGANLQDAQLVGADPAGANLVRRNLSGADLGGADIAGANLTNADLKKLGTCSSWVESAGGFRGKLIDWPLSTTEGNKPAGLSTDLGERVAAAIGGGTTARAAARQF